MAASPPSSRRAQILSNLQKQLRTITVANGYTHEVNLVSTDVRGWMEKPVAETPIIYVIDENTDYNYHAGKLTERTWTMGLYGFLRDQTQEDMEEFIADIEDCLMANVTLAFDDTGRVCSQIRVRNITTDNQLFSVIESSQLFKITIDILYTACVDSIR